MVYQNTSNRSIVFIINKNFLVFDLISWLLVLSLPVNYQTIDVVFSMERHACFFSLYKALHLKIKFWKAVQLWL